MDFLTVKIINHLAILPKVVVNSLPPEILKLCLNALFCFPFLLKMCCSTIYGLFHRRSDWVITMVTLVLKSINPYLCLGPKMQTQGACTRDGGLLLRVLFYAP